MVTDLFNIIASKAISPKIHFFRIEPTQKGLKDSLKNIYLSLSQLCWLSKFDGSFLKQSFEIRARGTLDYIYQKVINGNTDKSIEEAGEYVVSELSRQTIISEKKYTDIPLGELIKQKVAGNPGFDFFTKNLSDEILFAEAKYNSNQNAYGIAFNQIKNFITEKKDITDLPDIEKIVGEKACENALKNQKGYIAAFSTKDTPTDILIKNIVKNKDYQILSTYQELICVAVDIHE